MFYSFRLLKGEWWLLNMIEKVSKGFADNISWSAVQQRCFSTVVLTKHGVVKVLIQGGENIRKKKYI